MTELRVPPHSLADEQSLLGALMGSSGVLDGVIDKVEAEDFYRDSHRQVFDAIVALYTEGSGVDWLTVAGRMEAGALERVGGKEALATYVEFCPAFTNAPHYARTIHELRVRRDLIRAGNGISDISYEPGEMTNEEVIDQSEEMVFAATRTQASSRAVDIGVCLDEELERYEKVANGEMSRGLSTGFHSLDEIVGSFQPGNLIILAARPSVGKTALALNIASRVADEHLVAFYSLEMTRNELTQRLVASSASLNLTSIRASALKADELAKYEDTVGRIRQKKLLVDDDADLTMTGLRSKVRRLVAQKDVKLIVIDYLQLMTSGGSPESRQLEVAGMSRGLKLMAKQHGIPIICLSQLSRPMKEHQWREPVLSDLRDSGAIEQDADVVTFIHRPKPPDDPNEAPAIPELKIIVGKHRNGPLGNVWLPYRGEFTRFEEARRV